MYENSCCFEPTFTLNGIPILPGRCQALIAQGKAEAPVAVTHLALARSQKMGGGILGDTKDKETIRKGCLFICLFMTIECSQSVHSIVGRIV